MVKSSVPTTATSMPSAPSSIAAPRVLGEREPLQGEDEAERRDEIARS